MPYSLPRQKNPESLEDPREAPQEAGRYRSCDVAPLQLAAFAACSLGPRPAGYLLVGGPSKESCRHVVNW